MIKYLLILLPLSIFANNITLSHAKIKPLSKTINTNAKIIQLASQQQNIVSRLSGHVEAYFVTIGDPVKKGDKVALLESIVLSKMSADYLSLKKQIKAGKEQLNTSKRLYKKGLTSQYDLNKNIISIENIRSKENALASQLTSLGIQVNQLTSATDKFIIYAHDDGIVGDIFVSLHSNVGVEDSLMSIVHLNEFYAKAYVSVTEALKITRKSKAFITLGDKKYLGSFVQLIPTIDEETQQAKVLFKLINTPKNILMNTFLEIDIEIPPYKNVVMIKKTALSMFKGEWVVFMKEEEHKEEAHHEEIGYSPRVVNIIAYSGDDVAVEGIENDEVYVSEGVYFVKSMILKSSLGEHGH